MTDRLAWERIGSRWSTTLRPQQDGQDVGQDVSLLLDRLRPLSEDHRAKTGGFWVYLPCRPACCPTAWSWSEKRKGMFTKRSEPEDTLLLSLAAWLISSEPGMAAALSA